LTRTKSLDNFWARSPLPDLESGWKVLILPWVVGVRGMVDAKSVLDILDFL
jgi:hypothetical protein